MQGFRQGDDNPGYSHLKFLPKIILYICLTIPVYTDQPVSSASPPTRDKINGEEKARSRRRDTWAEPTTPPVTDDGKLPQQLAQSNCYPGAFLVHKSFETTQIGSVLWKFEITQSQLKQLIWSARNKHLYVCMPQVLFPGLDMSAYDMYVRKLYPLYRRNLSVHCPAFWAEN